MAKYNEEMITSVTHWSDRLFSFRTTRSKTLRFESGHFVMIGLRLENRPLLRAYSIASSKYEDHLEFLSIKIPGGPFTERLQNVKVGDQILVSDKPVGTLLVDDLLPGKNAYLFATGTGLAPFLSIIQDPQTYERFEKVVLVHSVRERNELAFSERISGDLPKCELMGEFIRNQLIYVPTVTREPFHTTGRITTLIEDGTLAQITKLPQLQAETDRVMLCGSPEMLRDIQGLLDQSGFQSSEGTGAAGHYVFERAFAER
ncbi:ferredoxin--NADP reductase [Bradyrhizobium sp. G127]|uniref:ferredoxin--NADP reductase n=1 Tax=Bradyrhizobium sp. G127 TaxID=2904800 RepID=UPI001F178940|nr:ferredoxin--NADP reductase [Bradyrhizobium sp. G127]MCF2524892.1 ferredoxin--NADP reductase [Bradyrhizobium sp. G127]